MLLLAAQSWSIDRGDRARHRSLGLAIFALVPLFFAGGAGVEHSMAVATGSGQDPFYNIWGPSLGAYDLVASLGFVAFTAMALRDRRRVARHAAWLLATPLLLVGPVLSRVYPRFIPGLAMHGPQDFGLFRWGIHLGGLTAIAIALWLWSRHRRDGRPWLAVAAINLVQLFLFETLGFIPGVEGRLRRVRRRPGRHARDRRGAARHGGAVVGLARSAAAAAARSGSGEEDRLALET